MICYNPDLGQEVVVRESNVSDHFLVYVDLSFFGSQQSNSFFKYRALNQMNLAQFLIELEHAPWRLLHQVENIDDKVSLLTDPIVNILTDMPLLTGPKMIQSVDSCQHQVYEKISKSFLLNKFKMKKF